MPYENEYDGIIIGAGHNGLILQGYLARAGLRVLSIDRALHAGGGLYTVEDNTLPGFYHNVHAVFLRGLTATAWYRDLELEGWGVQAIQPELNLASIQRNGQILQWFTDPAKTADSIAEFSAHDGAAWRRIAHDFAPIGQRIVEVELASAPLPPSRKRELLERSTLGKLYLQTQPLTPRQFIEENFGHPYVRAILLYLCIIREIDVNVADQGVLVPALIASRVKAQLAIGGSHSVARGLLRDIAAHGGHIMEKTEIERILVEKSRATGVRLRDGRIIKANAFVASSLNPQQTFLNLLDPSVLDAETARRAQSFQYQIVGPLFGIHLALNEAPRYAGSDQKPEVERAFLTMLGLEGPDEVYRLYAERGSGQLPQKLMIWGTTPTAHDPSQAPPGKHTAFMWQKVPYALGHNAENWDRQKQQHMSTLLEYWRGFAPNLTEENILSKFAYSPLDTERHFPNMTGGDLGVGWLGPDQRGVNRPLPGIAPYHTPIKNLYLCGASTHPGGNITGLPGYNAAKAVMDDLQQEPWWSPPSIEELWAKLD